MIVVKLLAGTERAAVETRIQPTTASYWPTAILLPSMFLVPGAPWRRESIIVEKSLGIISIKRRRNVVVCYYAACSRQSNAVRSLNLAASMTVGILWGGWRTMVSYSARANVQQSIFPARPFRPLLVSITLARSSVSTVMRPAAMAFF